MEVRAAVLQETNRLPVYDDTGSWQLQLVNLSRAGGNLTGEDRLAWLDETRWFALVAGRGDTPLGLRYSTGLGMFPDTEALTVLRSNLSASLRREAAHARRLARMAEWSVTRAC